MTKGVIMVPDIKNILYATDLSENAHYAFKYASTIANGFGATITILHVLEELSPSSLGIVSEIVGKERWTDLKKRNEEKVITSIRTRIEDVCNEISQSVPECPFIVQNIIVKTGHPVDQIIHYAEKKDCDMVVMGSRGHGILSETMLGSTSRRVLRKCTKPILVVRLPDSV
jgi:nucleotide-binding universal stress UspA family protein